MLLERKGYGFSGSNFKYVRVNFSLPPILYSFKCYKQVLNWPSKVKKSQGTRHTQAEIIKFFNLHICKYVVKTLTKCNSFFFYFFLCFFEQVVNPLVFKDSTPSKPSPDSSSSHFWCVLLSWCLFYSQRAQRPVWYLDQLLFAAFPEENSWGIGCMSHTCHIHSPCILES